MYILSKMAGMFLNVFFNYLWKSLDHVLENDFNFLWGIIIIEKVTGISSITNAFVLAKAQSWGISLVFIFNTFLFALLYDKGEKKSWHEGGVNLVPIFFFCSSALIFAFSEPCHLSGKEECYYIKGFKNESIILYFQQSCAVIFKVPFSCRR